MESHIEMLHKYIIEDVNQKNIITLLQKGDETLDYNEAVKKLPDSKLIIEEGGSHSFENIPRHFPFLRSFIYT